MCITFPEGWFKLLSSVLQLKTPELMAKPFELILIGWPHYYFAAYTPNLHNSPVPNLQLSAVLPAHIPSRTLHHPANPLYTRSSSCPILSRAPVTFHLMFSDRAISITAPHLWNYLPPEHRTFYLPPSPSLPITRHHLHPASPGPSTRN